MSDTGSETAPAAPATTEVSKDDKLWGTLCHVSPILGLGLLGPLVVLLVKGKESPFIDDQAKEALNFHITFLLAAIVVGIVTLGLGLLLLYPVFVILGIMAAIKANEGVKYRYPFAIRLIK